MKYSQTQLLRFPLLFGGLVSVLGLGFFYREIWLGDIEGQKIQIFKENAEGTSVIEDLKGSIREI